MNPFKVADVILKGLDIKDLPDDPLMDIMEGRKKERKQEVRMQNHKWGVHIGLKDDWKRDFSVSLELPKDAHIPASEIRIRLNTMFDALVQSISDSTLEKIVNEKGEEE